MILLRIAVMAIVGFVITIASHMLGDMIKWWQLGLVIFTYLVGVGIFEVIEDRRGK